MVFFYKYPTPDEVLSIGPVRNVARVRNTSTAWENPSQAKIQELERRVIEEVTRQIKSGRHLGTSVCVYFRGRQILYVLGGVFRSSHDSNWRPVDERTLFMSYSVAKGVSAMALLYLVDKGLISYDERVVDLWPEFGAATGKQDITVGDAVSHRAGLGSLRPFSLDALISCVRGHWIGDWRVAWQAGERFVENMVPEFEVGSYARYHFVSFSWIIGGILQRAMLRKRRNTSDVVGDNNFDHVHVKCVSDIVQETVGRACKCEEDTYIGLRRLCHTQYERVSLLEPMQPGLYEYPNPMSEIRVVDTFLSSSSRFFSLIPFCIRKIISYVSYWLFWFLAALEGFLFSTLANCKIWRGICLPSSNGYFTSQSVAVMYGALANGGVVFVEGNEKSNFLDRELQIFSKKTVDQLFEDARDETKAVPMHDCHTDKDSWGRHSKGFSPWPLPTLHGEKQMHSTLGHQGMGGCSSFGCAQTGLAVCIMRNIYDPLLMSEGSVKLDDGLLSQIIREIVER